MTASYRLIDYSLRSAKFAERKMLCEMLVRLRVFGSLETYRYIGFGSIWFADCVLFHRSLGIEHIISIEREQDHERRFHFNNPYRGIEVRMNDSSTVLPGLEWNQRTIVWLDYDDPLSPSILDDVRTVASRAYPGTALIVSIQAQKIFDKRIDPEEPTPVEDRDQFLSLFGEQRTPQEMPNAHLRGWRLSRTTRCIVRQEIENALQQVNIARANGQQIEFRQVVAFEYADGAKMTTIGGVFVDQGQHGVFEGADFGQLAFFRNAEEAVRIEVPMLTPREMRHLDRSLPCAEVNDMDVGAIPERDARHYATFYRYLPNFASFEP